MISSIAAKLEIINEFAWNIIKYIWSYIIFHVFKNFQDIIDKLIKDFLKINTIQTHVYLFVSLFPPFRPGKLGGGGGWFFLPNGGGGGDFFSYYSLKDFFF